MGTMTMTLTRMKVVNGPSLQSIKREVDACSSNPLWFTDHFGKKWGFFINEIHNHPTDQTRVVFFSTLDGERATLYYNPNTRKGDGIVGCWELNSPIRD